MSSCEKCWGEAYSRRQEYDSQTDAYMAILKEREDHP